MQHIQYLWKTGKHNKQKHTIDFTGAWFLSSPACFQGVWGFECVWCSSFAPWWCCRSKPKRIIGTNRDCVAPKHFNKQAGRWGSLCFIFIIINALRMARMPSQQSKQNEIKHSLRLYTEKHMLLLLAMSSYLCRNDRQITISMLSSILCVLILYVTCIDTVFTPVHIASTLHIKTKIYFFFLLFY